MDGERPNRPFYLPEGQTAMDALVRKIIADIFIEHQIKEAINDGFNSYDPDDYQYKPDED